FQIDQFSSQRTTEMRLARQNTLLQEYRLKAERAGYLPRLSAYFSHQQNAFRQEFNFLSNTRDYFTTNVVGVNLNVPIFTSFKKRNQVKQKQIDLELANINMDKVREGMQLEISNAQAQLKFEYNNYKTQQTNLELTEKIREQTRTKFSEGLSSSFDLNQAENQYLNAQAAYIQSIIKVSSAKSKLEKLLNP
ncbi:MAG: TolC family protein, partial [Luteibaculum sp.]